MCTEIIKKANKYCRNKRPYLNENKICEVFSSSDLLEIGFISKQCVNDAQGSCIVCEYGRAKTSYPTDIYIREMKKILSKYSDGKKFLLICCNGSFLDDNQIPQDLFFSILEHAQQSIIPNIIIETHFNSVTENKLRQIKSIISKPVIIELGLETTNQYYQDKIFMKGIDMNLFEKKIELIQQIGYKIEVNIMLGIPFLSQSEQISDTYNSVKWAIAHNCDPVIFPVNIKPYTLLYYAYKQQLIEPVSLWQLVVLLNNFNENELSLINLAWYGNREESYQNAPETIMPTACDICKHDIMSFCKNFQACGGIERKLLINRLIASRKCNCYDKITSTIQSDDFETNYKKFTDFVTADFQHLI